MRAEPTTHETSKLFQFGAFGGDTAYSAEALVFLLKGGRNALAGGGGDDPPPAEWLSESAWRMVLELSSLDGCDLLVSYRYLVYLAFSLCCDGDLGTCSSATKKVCLAVGCFVSVDGSMRLSLSDVVRIFAAQTWFEPGANEPKSTNCRR